MSYLRNSRFHGIFPNAAALPAAQVEEGSTAYVTDTNGLTGGASGVAGHVHWNGSQWVVHDLDAAFAAQTVNGGTSPVVVDGVTFTPTGVNNINIATRNVQTVTASATVNIDATQFVRVNASGGSLTLTLSASSASTLRTSVKRLDQSANTVTVVYSGGTIDSAVSIGLLGVPAIPGGGRGEGVELFYDPANPTDLLIV